MESRTTPVVSDQDWKSFLFCIEYFDTDILVILVFVHQLQISDTFRERNESVPGTRYMIHLQEMWHKNARLTK